MVDEHLLDMRLEDLYDRYQIDLFDVKDQDKFSILIKMIGICREIDPEQVSGICEVLVK